MAFFYNYFPFQKNAYDYEHSELLLYQNMVMQESGDHQGALAHLDKYEEQICDKLALLEYRGLNFIKTKQLGKADKIYRELIQRNPENHLYYQQLEVSMEANTIEDKLKMYQTMAEKFPKAQTPIRIPLTIGK